MKRITLKEKVLSSEIDNAVSDVADNGENTTVEIKTVQFWRRKIKSVL